MTVEILTTTPTPPPPNTYRWGTVTQITPLRVRLDGDTSALAVTPDSLTDSYYVGARVWVQLFGNRLIVVGRSSTPGAAVTGLRGAIRNDGSGWALIADANHQPFGISSVTQMSDRVRLTFAKTAAKVGTLVIGTDERFAEMGLRVGASVGTTYADIFIYRNNVYTISDYVSHNGTVWSSFNGVFTGFAYSGGVLTLTHADMGTGGDQAIHVTPRGTAAALAGGYGATTSQVVFYTSGWPGASPVAAGAANSAQHRCYVSRHGVRASSSPVDPATIDEDFGNFWFLGFNEI